MLADTNMPHSFCLTHHLDEVSGTVHRPIQPVLSYTGNANRPAISIFLLFCLHFLSFSIIIVSKLASTHIFYPFAIETAELTHKTGRRITTITEDTQDTTFLF